eukprot:gene27405-30976_t
MSDSDDDLPIAELIKKRKKIEAAKVAAAVKKTAVEKPKAPAASSNNASTKSTSAPRSFSQSSSGNKAADFYTETLKGQLVQSFLVRWWYAMEWPKMEEIGEPPAGYESLDGFPGVFISTRVDSLGQILDLRNKESCPCLKNVSKWSSAEIKDLSMKAFEQQMKELEEVEGSEVKLMRTLKAEYRAIKAIDTNAADKQASKYNF